jgi:triosephosphate isomerase
VKILIANWKANPSTLAEAQELFRAEISEAGKYKGIQTVICPPFVFIEELAKIDSARLGAQDIFWEKSGPFTGEISTEMLKNFGVGHVLVGHSDRRYKIGETDEMINKKIKAALEAGITPVLLVGEKDRKDDRAQILEKQLSADLDGLNVGQVSKVLIAYEPVWAISTTPNAEPDTSESTLEAIGSINEILSKTYNLKPITCLYGGSVTEKNVADFLSSPEISGAVIGGASLRKDEFANILRIVSEIE